MLLGSSWLYQKDYPRVWAVKKISGPADEAVTGQRRNNLKENKHEYIYDLIIIFPPLKISE